MKKTPAFNLPKGVMGGALVLVIVGSAWLLLHRPHPTGVASNSSAGTAPPRQAQGEPQETEGTKANHAGEIPVKTTTPEVGVAPGAMGQPTVDLNTPVDPALAAEVSKALEELKALYQPAGSLNWDQAKALIAKREQASKELVERLGRLGPGGARALAAALKQAENVRAQLLLVQGLGKVNDPEAAAVLQSLLQPQPEQSFSLRKEIVVALGQRREAASEQVLAGVLAQSDAQLRYASAQGLAGRENALPMLADRLRVEPNQEVRLELMRSVGLVHTPEAMNVLTEVAQAKGETIFRKTAIQELGRSFGASALPVLGQILGDPDESIRKSAVTAIARVKTNEAVTILQRAAETDASAMVSGAATAALASLQASTTAP